MNENNDFSRHSIEAIHTLIDGIEASIESQIRYLEHLKEIIVGLYLGDDHHEIAERISDIASSLTLTQTALTAKTAISSTMLNQAVSKLFI